MQSKVQSTMQSKQEVYDELKQALVELFEIDPEQITPEASLYEDLDIDSIDAIDMVMHFKDKFGKRIEPDSFKNVRTVQDVVDTVHAEFCVDAAA